MGDERKSETESELADVVREAMNRTMDGSLIERRSSWFSRLLTRIVGEGPDR